MDIAISGHACMVNGVYSTRLSVLDTHTENSEHIKDKAEEMTYTEENQYVDDNINDDTLNKSLIGDNITYIS